MDYLLNIIILYALIGNSIAQKGKNLPRYLTTSSAPTYQGGYGNESLEAGPVVVGIIIGASCVICCICIYCIYKLYYKWQLEWDDENDQRRPSQDIDIV